MVSPWIGRQPPLEGSEGGLPKMKKNNDLFRLVEGEEPDEEWIQRCQEEAEEFQRLVESGEINDVR